MKKMVKFGISLVLGLGAMALAAAGEVIPAGGVSIDNCGTAVITNRFVNKTGGELTNLTLRVTLPAADHFRYASGTAIVTLPNGVVWTNAEADPASPDGTNLVWEFTDADIAPLPSVQNVLISEVFYAGEGEEPMNE